MYIFTFLLNVDFHFVFSDQLSYLLLQRLSRKHVKPPLEDNPAVVDDNLDEKEVKPLVVPNQIPENQAGGGPCSVDMEVMSLRPMVRQQPTARQGVPF